MINFDDFLDKTAKTLAEKQAEIEKTNAELRKEERMARCGTVRRRLNPVTSRWYPYRRMCGYWRECEMCFQDRIIKFKKRYGVACEQTNNNVGVKIVEHEDAELIVRRLQREGTAYWRVPTEKGTCVFFDAGTSELHSDASGALLWDLLASTPPGMRSSGKLGDRPKEKKGRQGIKVKVPDWGFSFPEGTHVEGVFEEVNRRCAAPIPEFTELAFAENAERCERIMRDMAEEWGAEIHEKSVFKLVTIEAYTEAKEREKLYQELRNARLEAARAPELVQLPLQDGDPPPF